MTSTLYLTHNVIPATHQESDERGREREELRGQVTSLNEHLDLLQTELSSLTLERDELSSKLSNSSTDQVAGLGGGRGFLSP